MQNKKQYLCIDLKSFYASVECVERNLDPFTSNLVVADLSRTEKTICLAVSPKMKSLGVKGRCRVFEIPKNIDYIAAVPRMQLYIDYSARIYSIYLRYFAPQDIHVYSIDEVFIDISYYLGVYKQTALGLARKIAAEVLHETGITATCGIGTNLYLAKIAMDISSKHNPDNIGILNEESYKETLWEHQPITDFWRVGHGTAERLAKHGIHTMKEITQAPEGLLRMLFGIDAKLLIDHAWGRESTTIEDIKSYVPKSNSLTSGQVLARGYEKEEGRVIVEEMTQELVLSLVDKKLCTGAVSLYLGYEGKYREADSARVSKQLPMPTNSARELISTVLDLFERICDEKKNLKRITVVFAELLPMTSRQYDMFADTEEQDREYNLQCAIVNIKKKYGKNSIVKCMDLQDCATMMERNRQIGGHRA